MSRSTALLARQKANLDAAQQVKFIQQATEGTLTDLAYRRYLVVEEAFVHTAVRVLGSVVADSPSLDKARDHVDSLSTLVGEQREYFVRLRVEFPYDGDEASLVEESSILSQFALELAAMEGRPASLVAMFAAESLYLLWCGKAAQVEVPRIGALQQWIYMHTQPPFVAQVEALAREIDAMSMAIPDEHLDRWFSGMLLAENAFHAVP